MKRYEKKYTFGCKELENVREDLYRSKLGFKKSYPSRMNHTIYFDSFNYDDAADNLSGLSKRYKVRLRWYSAINQLRIDEDTEFQLEIKLRRNALGDKIVNKIKLPIKALLSNDLSIINFIKKQLPNEYLPYLNHCTNLSLGVFYQREYLVSKAFNIRATIDSNINYWNPDKFCLDKEYFKNKYEVEYGVVEIKYPKEVYECLETEDLSLISNSITPSRHSKYVVGSTLINK